MIEGPINITSLRDDETIDKIKAHLRKYGDIYAIAGSWFLFGYRMGKKRAPKVDEAAIVNAWLAHIQENGYHLYGLTPEQKILWQACWDYTRRVAKALNKSQSQVVFELTEDFVLANPMGIKPV